MTEQANTKKVRDIGEYDPKCDAIIIYIALGAAAIGATAITIWLIHTYVGWWNVFYAFLALVGLAFVLKSSIVEFIDDWLDYDRKEADEIIDQRLRLHSECLDYCDGESAPTKPSAAPNDKTDRAEDILLWAMAVVVSTLMLYGWWEERTVFAAVRFVATAVLSGGAVWWLMIYRSKSGPS